MTTPGRATGPAAPGLATLGAGFDAAATGAAVAIAVVACALALGACTTADTVAVVTGDPGADAAGSVDAPAYCADDGPPLVIGGDSAPTCAGALAAQVFRHALCACQEIGTNSTFSADSFDSRDGPYGSGGASGHVATNGKLQANDVFEVRGDLSVTGDPGITFGPELTVSGDLGARGILDGAAGTVVVAGDADVGGNVQVSDLTVSGTLRVPPEATLTVSGTQDLGALVREPVDVPLPCPCAPAELIDVAVLVEVHAGDNDNAAIGLDPAALADFAADTTIELPCGRFFLDRVQSEEGNLTIDVTGRAALFIDQGITLGRSLTVTLQPGGELDLFIADHINVAGDVRIGDPDAPSRVRAYVGGAGAINMSASSVLGANLYAPLTDLSFSADAELFGAAFLGRLLTSGPVRIHHDVSVRDAAASCSVVP